MGLPLNLVTVDPTSDPRWAALLDHPGASLFHSPPWLRAVCATYGFQPSAILAVDWMGRPQGGLAYCEISDGLGNRLVSFPFSDVCEPLLRDHNAWPPMLAHLKEKALPITFRVFGGLISPYDSDLNVAKYAAWHQLGLTRTAEEIRRQSFSDATRRGITKAERAGVTIRPLESAEDYAGLHMRLRKRKYRLLAQPPEFFQALQAEFSAVDGWLPLGAYLGDRLLAATVYLRWGDTLYYKFNASDPEGLAYRPNNLLAWAGIQLAQSLGCQVLDFGPSDLDQPGLIRFKEGFGTLRSTVQFLRWRPDDLALPTGKSIRNTLGEMTELLTRPEVPDEVTARAGALLYRFFV
jgi:hypothetical protein